MTGCPSPETLLFFCPSAGGFSSTSLGSEKAGGWTDVNELLKFIRPLHEGTLVFVASYDDPATKMNEETRKLFSDLGSKNVRDLAFRDSWVFVGAKGVQNKSPFEQCAPGPQKCREADGSHSTHERGRPVRLVLFLDEKIKVLGQTEGGECPENARLVDTTRRGLMVLFPVPEAEAVTSCSPPPQHVKNSRHTNKYEGWPEALEMEGCIPRRTTAS
ncbi:protein FAM3A isoform X3 [Desmodus rotundus]|uniref:protein FAM3A isoform X3 n=1 Tax=Desmodus rotundus TaxID=9430 RepID=UPI0023811389|nr:protein FAM3A isoform X3 [Desmodus rotundus]